MTCRFMVKFKELHVWVNRMIYLVVEGRDCNRVTSELNNKTLNNHKSECLSDLHPHPFFPFHCLMNCVLSVSLNHLTLNVSKCLAFLISPLSFPSLIINLFSLLIWAGPIVFCSEGAHLTLSSLLFVLIVNSWQASVTRWQSLWNQSAWFIPGKQNWMW